MHQIVQIKFENFKFFHSFLGGTSPSDIPFSDKEDLFVKS